MGQHGSNQQQNIIAIIPARLFSTRLPNKLLLPIGGKPLILWTLEQTKKAKNISRVIVAADSAEIVRVVEASEGGILPQPNSDDLNESMNSNAAMSNAYKRAYSTPVQAGALDVRSKVVLIVEIETDRG